MEYLSNIDPSKISVTRIGAGIFTINDYLLPQECAKFIALSEEIGFSEAVISTDDGDQIMKEVRNNDRIIHDNPDLAAQLFRRALPHLPPDIDGWHPSGLNERFRYYRYTDEQYFKWHQDGTFRRSDQNESFLTFMIYLNDGYVGGATEFGWETIEPKAGTALVFPHRLRHQGSKLVSGTKYVLRSDVMYTGSDA